MSKKIEMRDDERKFMNSSKGAQGIDFLFVSVTNFHHAESFQ